MIDAISPLVTGLFLWFKADAITNVASGAPIARWIDSSSSHFDAKISELKLQPHFLANSLNGKPAIRFSGAEKLSTPPLQLFHHGDDSLTLFAVFQAHRIEQPSYLVNQFSQTSSEGFALAMDSGSQASGNIGLGPIGGNAVISSANVVQPFTFYVVVLSLAAEGKTPDNVSLQINATPVEVTKYGSGWLDAGNYPTDSSPFNIGALFTGDIAEILAFSHQLSQPEVAKVGCYLRMKYNIAGASSWCSQ